MRYDPALRRDTTLARTLKDRIRRNGPVPVEDYMDACLNDPDHGYYRAQQAIGRTGDFITAPEISQVFGELIGLWCAVVWQHMGSPPAFNLVEVGPGRGTLMADALRAMGALPAAVQAATVHLMETSPAMRSQQRRTLSRAHVPIVWHGASMRGEAGHSPTIMIANEVIDAQPVAQIVKGRRGDRPRCVGLDAAGELAFDPVDDPAAQISELRDLHPAIAEDLASMPLAAGLVIDYGSLASTPGDSLQAVREHAYEHPLTSPGEADLSALVDFDQLARQCRTVFTVDGPVTQAAFLAELGITTRASRLMAANPATAGAIETGVARLMSPSGMGTRFKVLGLRSPGLAGLPGFTSAGV